MVFPVPVPAFEIFSRQSGSHRGDHHPRNSDQALLLLPLIDKSPRRHFSNRPWVIGITSFVTLGIIGLTALSYLEAPPPAEDSSGDPVATLYTENCAACHGASISVPDGLGPASSSGSPRVPGRAGLGQGAWTLMRSMPWPGFCTHPGTKPIISPWNATKYLTW